MSGQGEFHRYVVQAKENRTFLYLESEGRDYEFLFNYIRAGGPLKQEQREVPTSSVLKPSDRPMTIRNSDWFTTSVSCSLHNNVGSDDIIINWPISLNMPEFRGSKYSTCEMPLCLWLRFSKSTGVYGE